MLHLAQVCERDPEGKLKLVLLAQQKSENIWTLLPETDEIVEIAGHDFNVGMLVLADLDHNRQLLQVQAATDWVLDIVKHHLSYGLTPEVLQEEVERAEQWRQTLTLQSQELSRRALEMEARRDQIQELEENLKREKKQLETMAAEIKANTDS